MAVWRARASLWCWLGVLLVGLLVWPARVWAAEAARARALIVVTSAADRALVERIRGQVSDLDVELRVTERSPAQAAEEARLLHATALFWFSRDDSVTDRVGVHAAIGAGAAERVSVREVGEGAPSPSGTLSSATLEAAALVVREVLIELTTRDTDGVSSPPAAPAPASASPERAEPAARPGPAASVVQLRAQLGWQAALDGVALRSGPSFALGASYRAWELVGFARTSLPASERDRFGTIRLRRHAFALRGSRAWALASTLTLEPGVALGVVLFARGTQRLASNVAPRADRVTASFLFEPELRLGWAPGGGALEIGASVGLDVVPGAPRIGYEVDGRFEPSFSLWRAQPTWGLDLKFAAGRPP